ncbi:hypothetical protein E2C01_043730 [Portunus trituberculatus]|uniref:Uncharacterized protein n=1 Tax=Portunus trituberculatus TaxID=210409 RepID=A0A5B7FWG8_PORTR|nr:hypothetical protein [Portunus trituberculatus]
MEVKKKKDEGWREQKEEEREKWKEEEQELALGVRQGRAGTPPSRSAATPRRRSASPRRSRFRAAVTRPSAGTKSNQQDTRHDTGDYPSVPTKALRQNSASGHSDPPPQGRVAAEAPTLGLESQTKGSGRAPHQLLCLCCLDVSRCSTSFQRGWRGAKCLVGDRAAGGLVPFVSAQQGGGVATMRLL